MPPRLEDGLRDGRAGGRMPGDRGRSGDGRQPGLIQRPGLRLAAGPRNVGAAARRVRTLPAVTLSDTGGQEERTRSRRYLKPGFGCLCRNRRGVFAAALTRYLKPVYAAEPVAIGDLLGRQIPGA